MRVSRFFTCAPVGPDVGVRNRLFCLHNRFVARTMPCFAAEAGDLGMGCPMHGEEEMADRLKCAASVATAAALMAFAQVAFPAIMQLKMNGFLCSDGDFCDVDPTLDAISVTTGSNGVPVIPGLTATIAASSNSPGGGGSSVFDLKWSVSGAVGAGQPAALTIEGAQTGFRFPAGGQPAHLQSLISGDINGSLTGQQYISLTDTLFDASSTTPGAQGPFSAAFTDSAAIDFVASASYAIYELLKINLAADGSSTGEFTSTVTSVSIPEPAPVSILGLALAALSLARRRKLA